MLLTGAHAAAPCTSVTDPGLVLAGLGPAAVVCPRPGAAWFGASAPPGPPTRYTPAAIRTGTTSRPHR